MNIIPARRRARPEDSPLTRATVLHERNIVGPLVAMLRANVPALTDYVCSPMVDVPLDWRAERAETLIRLPGEMLVDGQTRATILAAVTAKLGLVDPTVTLHSAGPTQRMLITPRILPPESVSWSDVAPHIAAAPETAPVLGIGPGRLPVAADLVSDSPHVLVAGGTGAGKSVVIKILIAQMLAHGGVVVVCDLKRRSHTWLRDSPTDRVLYVRDLPDVHAALVAVGQEADRRNRAGDDPYVTETDIGPRLLLVMEEQNAVSDALTDYWSLTRTKDDPKRSPAVTALRRILFMGRSARINVMTVVTSGTARAIGGPEARENYALRCLARYTPQAWKMLAGDVSAPRKTRIVGRWEVVRAGEVVSTQIPELTDDEALALAFGGVTPARDALTSIRGSLVGRTQIDTCTTQVEQGAHVRRRTLRDALDQHPELATSLAALRRAASRTGFPLPLGREGQADVFDLDELLTWRRTRDALTAVRKVN